jgi:hypothetical protein
MGLDMYLRGKRYLSYREKEEYANELFDVADAFCKGKEINELTFELGYWRKANAIHNWFVNNVQEGVDNCCEYSLGYSHLVKLRQLCKEVLDNGEEFAEKFLPPASGFFFGNADVDEYYWEYVKSTYDLLTELCMDEDIQSDTIEVFYQSSW